MKVSLNWIRDYVQLPADADLKKLAYDLTMSTVEVEDATDLGASVPRHGGGRDQEDRAPSQRRQAEDLPDRHRRRRHRTSSAAAPTSARA